MSSCALREKRWHCVRRLPHAERSSGSRDDWRVRGSIAPSIVQPLSRVAVSPRLARVAVAPAVYGAWVESHARDTKSSGAGNDDSPEVPRPPGAHQRLVAVARLSPYGVVPGACGTAGACGVAPPPRPCSPKR